MKTMRSVDIVLIIYSIAIIVLTLSVDVTASKPEKHKKGKEKSKKYDYEDDMETTQDPTKKQKALMKDMKKVKAIQPAPIITYGPYTFEGVDYTDMPQNFYDTYHDCYYEHLRCIRFRTHLHVVCVYHLLHGWMDWTNHCQVDLTNCLHRLQHFKGFYGTSNRNDLIYYNGDGIRCAETLRSGKKPEPDSVVSFVRQRRLGNTFKNYMLNEKSNIGDNQL